MADAAAKPKSILKKPSRNARVVRQTAPPIVAASSQLPPSLQRLVSGDEEAEQPSLAAQLIAGTAPPPADAREKRNREAALHHARLIQKRKDLEADILSATETMIDWPGSPSASPSRPRASDVLAFQTLIPLFNTTDYDELIIERVCIDKCGYVFCPKMIAKDKSTARNYSVVQYLSGGEINIVKRNRLEMWCSAACAKRAMYIKVQLSETPAWERLGGVGGSIELLRDGDEDILADKMGKMGLRGDAEGDSAKALEENMVKAMEELALERGEKADSVIPNLVMSKSLVENTPSQAAQPPTGQIGNPGSIEAHVPLEKKPARSPNARSDDTKAKHHEQDDEDDEDWDLS